MFWCRFLCILILCFSSFHADSVLPVKAVNSLEPYKDIHGNLASASIKALCDSLNKKFDILKTLETIEQQTESDFEKFEKMEDDTRLQLIHRHQVINLQTIKTLRNKRCKALTEAMKLIGMERHTVNVTSFFSDIIGWRTVYLRKVIEGINNGEYSLLISSLPEELLIEGYVPNVFSCAISFLTDQDERVDVYFDSDVDHLKVSHNKTSYVFSSGNNNKAGDFCNSSLREQTNALTGDVNKNKAKIEVLKDLFRHSEQQAFDSLKKDPNIIGEIQTILKNRKIKEIVFHGNTLRDMCPNCRATLVGYEILAIRQLLSQQLVVDNILCTLQEAIVELTQGEKPPVTCLVSSFIEYQEGYRSKDVSWNMNPSYDLLNLKNQTSADICTNFVNQYCFSEVEFLEALLQQNIREDTIRAALLGRLEYLKQARTIDKQKK